MTTGERVAAILAASEKARASDKQLWLIFAQKSGVNLSPEQIRKIEDMPEFETLRRLRQKFQEAGRFKAAPSVSAMRKAKSIRMKQGAHYMNPTQMEQELVSRPIPFMEDGVDYLPDGRKIMPYGQ